MVISEFLIDRDTLKAMETQFELIGYFNDITPGELEKINCPRLKGIYIWILNYSQNIVSNLCNELFIPNQQI